MVKMENFERAEKLLRDGIETLEQAKTFVELLRGNQIKDKDGNVKGRKLFVDEEYGTLHVSLMRSLEKRAEDKKKTGEAFTIGEAYLLGHLDGMRVYQQEYTSQRHFMLSLRDQSGKVSSLAQNMDLLLKRALDNGCSED